MEAGLPAGILNVVNGDKEVGGRRSSTIRTSRPSASSARRRSREYVYSRATATGKRAQCFGGAKNHMIIMPDADLDQAADALIGAGYGSAGERCMAISVAVPVGKATADALMDRLIPRVENLKVGPSTDPSADFGPHGHQGAYGEGALLRRSRRQGRRQARGRRPRTSRCRATRTASTWAAACSTT